jgi:preprotein translocase subunit SecY
MLQKLITIFKVPELRRKILITLLFLAVYRVGWRVPLAIIDQAKLAKWAGGMQQTATGQVFGYVAMFSGTEIGQSTIFGLGIMPYISASIIFQLLTTVVPSLEKLSKEGETGRKKINEYTRYATVVLCLGQSYMWIQWMINIDIVPEVYRTFGHTVSAVLTMTAGTVFLMWIGEQIDEYGIGNGISLIIMAGILARMPVALYRIVNRGTLEVGAGGDKIGPGTMIALVALFIGVVVGVVLITQSQRRIPIQSAKHVRGHRVYGGTRQFMPLRVNQAGVMPIIFASSLLMFPFFLFNWLMTSTNWAFAHTLSGWFGGRGFMYNLFYVGLIYFFCYFWTAVTFNPKDMADNLKDYGSFIPGYRPGKRTADYLERVMLRITYVGAAFLAVVAVIPAVVSNALQVDYMIAGFYGGTGLLIVVSVALDIAQRIESHLLMRDYGTLM